MVHRGVAQFGTASPAIDARYMKVEIVKFKRLNQIAFGCIVLLSLAVTGQGQSLYRVPDGVSTRWASPENRLGNVGQGGQANGGRKGSASVPVKANDQVVLAESHGVSGTVRRIWMTLSDRSPAMLRGLKIEMFWDGSARPAVSAPVGDFFAFGSGHMAAFQSTLFSSPEGKSFDCFIPMPFKTGMKIVLTNESAKDLQLLFYDVDYTVGDEHGKDDLFFHAHFFHQSPTELKHDFEVLPETKGKGRFLGASFGVRANQKLYGNNWWGEGEVKMYVDGDQALPTLVGTGTEDYVGSGWGLGQFSQLYQGATYINDGKGLYSFYRFHIPDPVYFRSQIKVTIQQIGFVLDNSEVLYTSGTPVYRTGPNLDPLKRGERATFERQDDWSAVAYFYLDTAEDTLPEMESPEKRMTDMSWGGPVFGQAQ